MCRGLQPPMSAALSKAAPSVPWSGNAATPRVGGRGTAKYPINTAARARNAVARVNQHGSAAEKKLVYAKVRSRYPALAARSTVIPTRTGTGRHYGQPKGTTNRGRR